MTPGGIPVRRSVVSIFLLVVAAQSFWAGDRVASANAPTETISILGQTFHIVPFKLEDTPRIWAEVKPYLPEVLLEKSKEPLTKRQILGRVDQPLHDRMQRYDADLKTLTDRHLKEFLKATPQANWDWFNMALAGDCIADKPGPYLPRSTVHLCQEYTALLYLEEMLSKATAQAPPNSTTAVAAAPVADAHQSSSALTPLSTFKDCDQCPEMVVIPPGAFLMGASRQDRRIADRYTIASELPQHSVTIGYSLAISRFEVTVGQFAAFVKETGAKTGGECLLRTPDLEVTHRGHFMGTPKPGANVTPGLVTVINADFRTPGQHVTDNYPATCISRREALQYLQWLSKKSGRQYRFPTEAEWEYATRAGSTTLYYFPGPVSNLCKFANFADRKSPYGAAMAAPCAEQPSPEGLAPVGSYRPNAWGLYDTIGNAFEFIADCRFPNYRGAPTDGSPWREQDKRTCPSGFVTRGYFFDSIYTDLRSAARCTAGDKWNERENFLSLRVAVSLDDKAWDRLAAAGGGSGLPSVAASTTAAQSGERWIATSTASLAITGNINIDKNTLIFGNGKTDFAAVLRQKRNRQLERTGNGFGTIYKLVPPSDPKLLHGNTLCGTPITYIVLSRQSERNLSLTAFSARTCRVNLAMDHAPYFSMNDRIAMGSLDFWLAR